MILGNINCDCGLPNGHEITCGRSVETRQEPSKVSLVEWVWNLYGRGQLLDAVDKMLCTDSDERQMECLMKCCHPDYTLRPSIRQVINVLNFESSLPTLPSKLPVPMYYAPPMSMGEFSYTSSGITADSESYRTQCSCSSCSPKSSMVSPGPTKALLNTQKSDI